MLFATTLTPDLVHPTSAKIANLAVISSTVALTSVTLAQLFFTQALISAILALMSPTLALIYATTRPRRPRFKGHPI